RSPYWLLGYEWPNQGSEAGRRADLVGLTPQGGLAVFECKVVNRDTPFTAVLEGLDYLTCLTSEPNFQKIQSSFAEWTRKPGKIVPEGFVDVRPDRTQEHEVIVLAPKEYFGTYCRTDRGHGWDRCNDVAGNPGLVKIRFAQC